MLRSFLALLLLISSDQEVDRTDIQFGPWRAKIDGCTNEDAEVGTVFIRYSATLKNGGSTRLIVPRDQTVTSNLIAISEKDGQAGKLEGKTEFDFVASVTPIKRPKMSAPPPRDYVIVKPGEETRVNVVSTFIVRRRSVVAIGTIPEGESRSGQSRVSGGSEVFGMRPNEVSKRALAWRQYGNLMSGPSATGWVVVSFPSLATCRPTAQ